MSKRRRKYQIVNDKSLKKMYDYLLSLKKGGIIIAPNPTATIYDFDNKLKVELIKRGGLKIVENKPHTNYVKVEVVKGWKP